MCQRSLYTIFFYYVSLLHRLYGFRLQELFLLVSAGNAFMAEQFIYCAVYYFLCASPLHRVYGSKLFRKYSYSFRRAYSLFANKHINIFNDETLFLTEINFSYHTALCFLFRYQIFSIWSCHQRDTKIVRPFMDEGVGGLAWSLYKCAALWRAVYGTFGTERPLGTIREEKGISSRFRVSISSRYDLSC